MGDKGKKDKQKDQKQHTEKQQQKAKKQLEKQPKRNSWQKSLVHCSDPSTDFLPYS